MKFFLCIAALVAVAVASPLARNQINEIEAIVAAINSPNTDPATGALLQEQLATIIAEASPISVSPVFIEEPSIDGIAVGPVFIETPAHDGGAVTAEEPAVVNPTPAVVIGDLPAGSATPLVQIIVKVNNPEAVISPVAVGAETITPGAVNWVDGPDAPVVTPVQVAEPVVPGAVNWVDGGDSVAISPVQVAEPVVPGAVNWVDGAETVAVEPIAIGTPIIPIPVVAQPEALN